MISSLLQHGGVRPWAPTLVFFLMRFTLTALTLLYTDQSMALRRISAFTIVLISCLQLLFLLTFPVSVSWATISATDCFALTIHQINLLIITKVERDDLRFGQQTGPPAGKISQELAATFYQMISIRGIHTKWQAKNTPTWPRIYDRKHMNATFFIKRQSAIAIWQIMLLVFLFAVWQRWQSSTPMAGLTSSPATSRELGRRVMLGVSMWFLLFRVMGDIYYRITSIMATLIGVSSFTDWPPLFNSFLEAWTLRRFWGVFWHQSFRWPFCSLATIITQQFLSLRRPSFLERYTHILCVFVISGLMHTIGDMAQGMRWNESGALLFFSSFALGIMVEDGAQAAWRWMRATGRRMDARMPGKTPIWQKVVGFIWVALWLAILTPYYLGGTMQTQDADASLSQLSLISDLHALVLAAIVVIGAIFLRRNFGASP
ncbi:membrane bound O-acyl transferase family-domain-containing protein [Aspergillus floccosus]